MSLVELPIFGGLAAPFLEFLIKAGSIPLGTHQSFSRISCGVSQDPLPNGIFCQEVT